MDSIQHSPHNTRRQQILRNLLIHHDDVIDQNLPAWARRSNPIVRRELGDHWKRLFPNITLMRRIIWVQMLVVLLLPMEFLMTFTLPVAVLSVLVAPFVLFLYARVILTAIDFAAEAIVRANINNTLDLLRVSKIPLDHIVLGKIAASIWRRMDDLDLVLMALSALSMPFLSIYYMGSVQPEDITLLSRLSVVVGMAILPLRVMVEPFMLSAISIAAGSMLPTRAATVITTMSFAIFYYLMLTVSFIAFRAVIWQLMFGAILPIAIPVLVAYLAVKVTHWRIERL